MSATNQPDINNLELMNEVVEVDGSVDSEEFFKPLLPDDGPHECIVKISTQGLKLKRQKDRATGNRTGNGFVEANLALQIVDENGQPGPMVFDNPNTVKMNSGTSRLHAVMDLCGDKIPDRATFAEIMEHIERATAQDLRCGIVTEWEAQIEDPPDSKQYREIKRGQRNFAQILDAGGNPTGEYDPEILDPKTGQRIRARARPVRYFRLQSDSSVSVA